MMGVYAAFKTNTPLVAQHCTDLREYVEHYRDGLLLPGLLALIALLPFAVKMNGRDIRELMSMYRPRRGSVQWNGEIVEHAMTLIYSKCDAVIALSRKSKKQLESWQKDPNYKYTVTLMPNGVNRIKPPTARHVRQFREKWNIAESDAVFGFVGRLGAEKNLDLLIPACEKIVKKRPNARLLFIGDFEHREALEAAAAASSCPDRITFTGSVQREKLGVVYDIMNVFVFPSLTDTQGWAVHEAALAGLPLVLIDKDLSEVLEPGVNGEFARNTAKSVADVVVDLLSHPKKRAHYGEASKKLARRFTERRQIKKLAALYEEVIATYSKEQGKTT
jgi:glycosyltransferase involved in cell wall biosynthesis